MSEEIEDCVRAESGVALADSLPAALQNLAACHRNGGLLRDCVICG
jgi:hypothetical protein